MRFNVAVVLLLNFCLAISARAEPGEREPLIKEGWSCGTAIEVTPELVAFMKPSFISGELSSDGGAEKLRPFVAGTLRDPIGANYSMLYVSSENGWIAYPVGGQAGFSNAYVNQQSGQAVLFSMVNVEGPGQSYTSFQPMMASIRSRAVPYRSLRLNLIRSITCRSNGSPSILKVMGGFMAMSLLGRKMVLVRLGMRSAL